jgi:hypothetical protein
MIDVIYLLGDHYSTWLLAFAMSVCVLVGAIFAFFLGSVRWWWVKKTRLPTLWKNERRAYLARIASLEHTQATMQEEIDRLKTAAYGSVLVEFRRSTGEAYSKMASR